MITQCLQNDFVKPVGKHDPLPNMLHVGYEEARRLMGENPEEGPVARMMQWAYGQTDEQLRMIHIHDWHSPDDPFQLTHLKQFGFHCIRDTDGAKFVFPQAQGISKKTVVVDSLTLNDFQGTNLKTLLEPVKNQPVKIGLVGVWTEAKITFLAYELRTRYPDVQLAVCSALTASSSTARHFIALDQLERLLGVQVFSSVGKFVEFLGGEAGDIPFIGFRDEKHPVVEFEESAKLSETDSKILRYLFRDSRTVQLRCLDGGYSGNVVLASKSTDMFGHEQVPHVLKIGSQELVGRERTAFERIESVLGNNAPRVADFADFGDRGGIKYRYASMGGSSTTFQKLYSQGVSMEKVKRILRTVFSEQLGRLYAAGSREKCDLLEYYWFSPDRAPSVRKRVETLLGQPAAGSTLCFPNGKTFPNVCLFYEEKLGKIPGNRDESAYFAYVHGDLNGANIIVDGQENVWLIDFFHTHRGHILRDLIKLENDLLYIFTPVNNEGEFDEALRLTDLLMHAEDLALPMPSGEKTGLKRSQFLRAYETLCFLRSFYPVLIQSDLNPLQLFIGQMRYAAHTLSFHESNDWQKKWALYTASLCSREIIDRIQRNI